MNIEHEKHESKSKGMYRTERNRKGKGVKKNPFLYLRYLIIFHLYECYCKSVCVFQQKKNRDTNNYKKAQNNEEN